MSSRNMNGPCNSPGSNQINGYNIDPNLYHQRQHDQQHLQLKLQMQQQQGVRIPHQQAAHLHNYHLQRAAGLPNYPRHAQGSPSNYMGIADSLRQRQQLIASAASRAYWGVPPPGVPPSSPQQQHPTSHSETDVVGRKRSIAAVSGGPNHPGPAAPPMGWNQNPIQSKQARRSEKKREQEKQRRSDLNEKFGALIQVVKRIETEDDEIERKRTLEEDTVRKRKAAVLEMLGSQGKTGEGSNEHGDAISGNGSASLESTTEMICAARREFKRRFPCFISPSNRSDLIARAVSHLVKYREIRKKLDDDLDAMRKRVEEVHRRNAEAEEKLRKMESFGTSNPMGVQACTKSGGSNDAAAQPPAPEDAEKATPSTTSSKDDNLQQPQQMQQQPQQMMMMMPMMMNPDGSFNQQCAQQFMPMPMASMGSNMFNNMMVMMPPSSQVATPPKVEPQDPQMDQEGMPNQPEGESQSQTDDKDEKATPIRIDASTATRVSDDSTKESVSSPSTLGVASSRFSSSPPSPVLTQFTKMPVDAERTSPSTESKRKLSADSGTLSKSADQQTNQNGLEKKEKFDVPPSDKSVNDETHNDSEPVLKQVQHHKDSSGTSVPAEEIGTPVASSTTEAETTSLLKEPIVTKESSCETMTKVPTSVTLSPKTGMKNAPLSPAVNIPPSEGKLFPSPVSPPLEMPTSDVAGESNVTPPEIPMHDETVTQSPSVAKTNEKSAQQIREAKMNSEEPQSNGKNTLDDGKGPVFPPSQTSKPDQQTEEAKNNPAELESSKKDVSNNEDGLSSTPSQITGKDAINTEALASTLLGLAKLPDPKICTNRQA